MLINISVYFFIYSFKLIQPDIGSKVFSLHMKTGSNRNMHFYGSLCRSHSKHKRHHNMHRICTVQCTADNFFVRLCKGNANLIYICVKKPAKIKIRHNKCILFADSALIGTQNSYCISPAFHISYQIHGSNGCAVIFFSEHITYNRNNHSKITPPLNYENFIFGNRFIIKASLKHLSRILPKAVNAF